MADKIVVPVIAGLAAGIALLIIFAIVFAPYSSRLSASDVTRDDPYGIHARVVYVHAFSGILCPSLPCDASGFVLQIASIRDVMILGYEACDVASTCVYSDGVQETHLLGSSKTLDGNSMLSFLGKKSNWQIGDSINIRVKAAPAIEKLENNIISWHANPSEPAAWVDFGRSRILELDAL